MTQQQRHTPDDNSRRKSRERERERESRTDTAPATDVKRVSVALGMLPPSGAKPATAARAEASQLLLDLVHVLGEDAAAAAAEPVRRR